MNNLIKFNKSINCISKLYSSNYVSYLSINTTLKRFYSSNSTQNKSKTTTTLDQKTTHRITPTNINNINSEILKETPTPSSKLITVDQLAGPEDYNYVFSRSKICDKENYLCTLLISDISARRCAFAIRAFNIETLASDLTQKQEKMSKLRLSFWKEAINNYYLGKVYDQPISRVLAQFIKEKQLSKIWFTKLINRREKDLTAIQIKDMDELEAYCDDIQTSMLLLTLEGLGFKGNHDIEHCASHLGKAVGLMILIRGTPIHIAKRKIYIPVSLCTKHGINVESLYRGDRQNKKLKEAIFEMASSAKVHLDKARSFKIPSPANQAFMVAGIVEDFLEKLRKVDFDVYHLDNAPISTFTLLKLYKNKFFKKF